MALMKRFYYLPRLSVFLLLFCILFVPTVAFSSKDQLQCLPGVAWLQTYSRTRIYPSVVVFSSERTIVTNSQLGQHSHDTVHVGNLNWSITPSEITKQLLNTLGPTKNPVVVTVHKILQPTKKREKGKQHCGSATVTFATNDDAQSGMQRLLKSSQGHQWKIRWAWTRPSITPMEESNSSERMLLRKTRAESHARAKQRLLLKTKEVILSAAETMNLSQNTNDDTMNQLLLQHIPVLEAPKLDWSSCPEIINPIQGGGLVDGTLRGQRKQAAVEAFLHVLRNALMESNTGDLSTEIQQRRMVADLGSGTGNLSLPLAWWLKELGLGVLAVDIDGHALSLLSRRAKAVEGITIETMEQDLMHLVATGWKSSTHDFATDRVFLEDIQRLEGCSAVVSLHACGSASDLAMAVAISHSLPFAISPCCIGKLNASRRQVSGRMAADSDTIQYPRSRRLMDAMTFSNYQLLAAAADYGVGVDMEDAQELARRNRCRSAKQIVETDRLQWAQEMGYDVRIVELPRIGPLYPKRELLLGAKRGSAAASRIACLPVVIAAASQE